jgi:hypothetical protein
MTHPTPPRILADLPVSDVVLELLGGRCELLPWETARHADPGPIEGIYTYGHPTVDAHLLDQLRGVRVISNFGVGVIISMSRRPPSAVFRLATRLGFSTVPRQISPSP